MKTLRPRSPPTSRVRKVQAMLRTTRLLICLKAGVMRYVGLASLLFLSLLAGYFYMDNRRLDARVVAEVASHQQTKANIRAGQAEAAALDAKRLLEATRQAAATNERIQNAYQADLAALRARA